MAHPHPADRRVPISVLASVDPVLRDSAIFGLVVDSPGTVVLRHDILAEANMIRRVVVDATGVVEQALVPLEHVCLSCAVREDALPTLAALTEDGRWTDVTLALPVSAESLPATRALAAETGRDGALAGARIATAAAVVDVETFERDLLSDTLLSDLGLGLTDQDGRAVGEALAAQVEHADLVVVAGDAGAAPTGSGLVDRLRAADSHRVDSLHGLTSHDLTSGRHDPVTGERRTNPLSARGCTGRSHGRADASWTLELRSDRPLHPERLLERIEDLGTGRLRSRGVFRVADRPRAACHWDGAGGQLYIGELGPWADACAGARPQTRLVFVGAAADADLRPLLREAFEATLLTDAELADGELVWLGREDILEPWLGTRTA